MKGVFRIIQYSLCTISDNCKTKLFLFWSGISLRLLYLVIAIFFNYDVITDDVNVKNVEFFQVEITSNKVSVTTIYATMMWVRSRDKQCRLNLMQLQWQ